MKPLTTLAAFFGIWLIFALLFIGFWSASAWAALTYQQDAGNWNGGNPPTLTSTFGSNASTGDLVVVSTSTESSVDGTTTLAVSGLGVVSWTKLGCEAVTSGLQGLDCEFAGIVVTPGKVVTVTQGGTAGQFLYITSVDYSGAPASVVQDGSAAVGNGAAGTAEVSPAYASSNAADLIACNIGQNGGVTGTAPGSPWTNITAQNTQEQLAYQIVSGTASFQAAWTVTGSWQAVCAGIELGAAPTPTPTATATATATSTPTPEPCDNRGGFRNEEGRRKHIVPGCNSNVVIDWTW